MKEKSGSTNPNNETWHSFTSTCKTSSRRHQRRWDLCHNSYWGAACGRVIGGGNGLEILFFMPHWFILQRHKPPRYDHLCGGVLGWSLETHSALIPGLQEVIQLQQFWKLQWRHACTGDEDEECHCHNTCLWWFHIPQDSADVILPKVHQYLWAAV